MKRALFVALSVALPAWVAASTVIALPEAELTQRADAIVFGRVVSARTLVSSRNITVTEAELQVYDAVKGPSAGAIIKIQMPGGQANGLVYSIAGAPTLVTGQMWVGFLTAHGSQTYTAWGMGYGLLPVRQAASGELRVFGSSREKPATVGSVAPPSGSTLTFDDLPLADFLARLRGHLLPATPGTPTLPGGVQGGVR